MAGPSLTPELFIRWAQWAMFNSHARLYGFEPYMPWVFGDRALEIYRRYAKLRYRLMPYIYSQAYKATRTGLPMMRAMVLEFQDDPNTYSMEDQYMFGDAFLVAPVYTPVNRRTVYLPEGRWSDYWTGEEHEGPTTLRVEPPLEVMPVYVKSDSIIPMGPDMAYLGEKPVDPITLDVRLLSGAEFTLYDDDEVVECRASRRKGEVVVEVSASRRSYVVKLNKTGLPARAEFNGVEMPRASSHEELEKAGHGWYFDPSLVVYARFNALGSRSKLVLHV